MLRNSRFVIERRYEGPRSGTAKSIKNIWIKIGKAGRRAVAEAILQRALVDGGTCRIREA
jgi:hypothetical protein